ncbi:MFS transporter asaE [Pseudocercospora fuligena]|uniref:MFS transporter asaE n=1 Tax=Pseudocercospora fuligena TaxID=685502 RepID=A0A8H6VFL5_9PEZI|nr:MFS transporter asaE [Pseudocercospora fuligena]
MSQHELRPVSTDHHASPDLSVSQEESPDANLQSLPPADHGKAACRLLLAAFIFEALLWGFPLSFGVFQAYYSQIPEFAGNPFISVVGSVASGISYIAAPIMIPITKRYSKHRKHMILIGWPICLLALIAGSFAKNLGTLILTQGVMYGLGFVVFYYPILSFVNEWWVERRGMAYGLLCSASGVSGAVFPFAIEQLLHKYGYQTTLRAIAIGLAVLTGPLIPFLKGRVPETSSGASSSSRTDWTFLKTSTFWTYNISNLAMGFGFFFPALYLPSYAANLGLSPTKGALLLATMSVSQVLGQMSFGYASDWKKSIDALAITASFVAAVIAFAGWGLARSFGPLVVFSIFYGFFGTGYTALWGRMGTKISDDPSAAFAAFGLLNLGKGIGNVLAGPIGGGLVRRGNMYEQGYGTGKYERVVIFTGVCMAVSALVIVVARSIAAGKRLGWRSD